MFAGLGADGTAAAAGSPSSSIRAEVQDPAPGVSSMGGKLVFATSAAGTVAPVDRMTIDNQVRLLARTSTVLCWSPLSLMVPADNVGDVGPPLLSAALALQGTVKIGTVSITNTATVTADAALAVVAATGVSITASTNDVTVDAYRDVKLTAQTGRSVLHSALCWLLSASLAVTVIPYIGASQCHCSRRS